MPVKVWLGGEGPNEIGTRAEKGDQAGTIEALLRKVEVTGWEVAGARRWQHIRKFRAGQALRGGENHEDIHNVMGLALEAWEAGCEVVAFSRDADADGRRANAVAQGIKAAAQTFSLHAIVGGIARPALEGWILALLKTPDTDGMSRLKTLELLDQQGVLAKSVEAYVSVVEEAELASLPNGCSSLRDWLAAAKQLSAVVHGKPPSPA